MKARRDCAGFGRSALKLFVYGLLSLAWAEAAGCHDRLPDSAVDAAVSSMPAPNGSCGPTHAHATTPDADAATPVCDLALAQSDAAVAFTAGRPLGFGYPDDATPLPDHVAYLTFDDGPSDWTNDILDTLRKNAAHATFFVTAEQLKGAAGLSGSYVDEYGHREVYAALLKRELDDGHAIGNHTVNHPDLGMIHDQQVESELDENELLVNAALVRVGAKPQVLSLFRPPFGSPWYSGPSSKQPATTAQVPVAARISNHGLNIMWNVDSSDSREWAQGESYSRTIRQSPSPGAPSFSAKKARIVETVLMDSAVSAGAGIVVLMHDTHPTTRDALQAILDGLRAAGYEFQTLEQYAMWRWQRPSLELTPGPNLYSPCMQERDWGCLSAGTQDSGEPLEVCGRLWSAYTAFGGAAVLGLPLAPETRSATSGIVSQRFEHGVVELHPENPPPCNIVVLAQ